MNARRRRSWVLALALPLLLSPGPPLDPRAPACPPGLVANTAHASAIRDLLAADDEASALLVAATGHVTLCFGAIAEPSITRDGVVQLDATAMTPEAAARVAHLVHHRRAGSPLAGPPSGDCARWVDAALDEEAQSYALELRLLRDAGRPSGFPFADEAQAAPADQRIGVIYRWLREHREGGPGVPALMASYQARCATEEDR